MTESTLITLLVQTGFAGLFVWLLRDVRQEQREREVRESAARVTERAEAIQRENRLMALVESVTERMDKITDALDCLKREVEAIGDDAPARERKR